MKREVIVVVSYGGRKTPKAHHIPTVVLGPPQIPTKLSTRKLFIPIILQFIRMLPPLIQMSKIHYTNVHPLINKIHLPFTQIILHPTKFHLLNRVLLPTRLTFSRATEYPLLFIKSKFHYTKILPRITKLHHQTAKQIHIPKLSSSSKYQ